MKSTVYILHYTIGFEEDGEADLIVGIYSSEVKAKQAIDRLAGKPGFDNPRGSFSPGPYVLDQTHWATGFGFDD